MNELTRGRRLALGWLAAGLGGAGFAAAMLGFWTSPASGQERAGSAVVKVTAGKPSEFAFTLAKAPNISAGSVTFMVTNRGALSHQFKICSTPVKNAKLNTCIGTGTRLLGPGQSASLAITFKRHGTYEYLSSTPGQAARGMKGLIGIGPPLSAATTSPAPMGPATTTPAATTSGPATSATTPGPTSTGDPVAGATVWQSAGCSSCHTLAEVRGNITPGLNSSHGGGPFSTPLTPQQIADLTAYVNASR